MQKTQRINWIDWAKAAAVTTVVFCHLPQSQDWFYYRYLQSCIITIFFFLSGYLKKDRGSAKDNWSKYWHSLVIPYFLYNLLIYPFWIIRFYLQNGGLPNLAEAMKPVIGTLLLQSESSISVPLDGPLWYLPAILFMHLLIDFLRNKRSFQAIMTLLCALSVVLYGANKLYGFAPYLTVMGIFRRLPYFYLGYVLRQKQLFGNVNRNHDAIGFLGCFALSLLTFYWHLHEDVFALHILLFYPVNFLFLFGVLYGSKLLNSHSPKWMVNLSVGTLVIIGLHVVLISGANYVIGKLTDSQAGITYHWYEALPVALLIVLTLYPIILFGKRYCPTLLGRGK